MILLGFDQDLSILICLKLVNRCFHIPSNELQQINLLDEEK